MNFEEMLDRLAGLTNEQLAEFHAQLVELFTEKRTAEMSVSTVQELASLADAIDNVTAEMTARRQSADQLAADVAAIADRVEASAADATELATKKKKGDDEDEDEGDAEGDDSATPPDPQANPVTASGDETPETPALTPAGLGGDGADLGGVFQGQATITAGADIPGMTAGTPLDGVAELAAAFMNRRGSFRGLDKAGDGDRVIVASIHGDYPEERTLKLDALSENMEKIEEVTSPGAIVASGGLCAPLEPYYGIQVLAQADRPVRDALANFGADRGGVRYLPPPVLTDLTGSIGVTTAAQDGGTYGSGGGQTPFKPCLHVTCGTEQTATIYAVHRCLTFGNFAARTYPEQVQAWLQLSMASHARRAETVLLDAISAHCTQVTAAATYSAVRSLLPQIDQITAAYRSRHRAGASVRYRILLPTWVKELLRSDITRSWRGDDDGPATASDAQITEWFSVRGVTVSWYIDTETGKNQIFGAQSAGALLAFPSTVRWYFWVEGSFVFLDGGTLDLGLVRDSTLNSTNDYQIFAETFEGVAFFGIEALAVTSTVCPNGAYAPAASALAPC